MRHREFYEYTVVDWILKMWEILLLFTYLNDGGNSLIRRKRGQTPNCDDRNIATPSVLSFTERLYFSDKNPPGPHLLL